MATELSLDNVKEMKKADFLKAFKNKAVWKKAKALIVMVDYKLDGKKSVVAIPFKKETDMKAEMKRLKKEKIHMLKKTGGGTIEFIKSADGMQAKIDILMGGLAPDALLNKGQELFNKIKATLLATQSEEALADAAEAASEVEEPEAPQDDKAVLEGMNSLISEIKTLFKDKVQQAVGLIKGGGEVKEEHLEHAENTSDLIGELKETFENATEAVKTQVKGEAEKLFGLMPNLDKIKSKLGELLGSEEDEEGEDENDDAAAAADGKSEENNKKGKKLSTEQKEKIKANKVKLNTKLDEILSMLEA